MILSELKPTDEILGFLKNDRNVFILSCNGCAQSSGTGGPQQMAAMKARLWENGKTVTGTMAVDFLCEKALVSSRLWGRREQISISDSILVMGCGIGVQAVAASVPVACHPACNTLNLGGTRGKWPGSERCDECGECVLDYTGGICPRTACTKGLMNGQCGGASNGKCEINPGIECGWERIYKRMESLNQLDKLKSLLAPRDYAKSRPAPKIVNTPIWAIDTFAPKEVSVR
jgi:hypothetical protein